MLGCMFAMATTDSMLDLRPGTVDDAGLVADLDAARSPDDPRDPVLLRFWWANRPAGEQMMRQLAERDGKAIAFVQAFHLPWDDGSKRFGRLSPMIDPRASTQAVLEQLITGGESWLREEGASVVVVRRREDLLDEISLLERLGYREVRREKSWELDLVSGAERLLAEAKRTRLAMEEQGVRLLTLDQDADPDVLAKLYEMETAAEHDIPTTVPWRTTPYVEWFRGWFENPSTRRDRFWIAREGSDVMGLSVIGYPPVRGVPWTAFTATSRKVRGRGVARALKYESVAQAIELGVERIRTANDGENAPILHINHQMGYVPVHWFIELHKELTVG
jgi:GNAT superfamily N-acetyltransferase